MIFDRLLGKFSQDLGVDLGTSNTIFYARGKGIVVNEPTVVAINTRTDQLVSVGIDARKMVGKTPPHINVIRPIVNGIIYDFEITEKLLKHLIEKIHRESFTISPRPRVICSIPLDLTEVERKAVEDALLGAGAREVHLIQEPVATAIGARLNLQDSYGRMIVEIGGGKTSMAIISLSGIVSYQSLKIAGDELDNNIRDFVKENFNVIIGQKAAEEIKIKIGSAGPGGEGVEIKAKGRNLLTGLPKEFVINDNQVREAIKKTVRSLVDHVRLTIENAPAEVLGDIHESGILLSGGSCLLKDLDKLINREVQIPVTVVDDPLTTVARGTGILAEDENLLKEIEGAMNL